MSAHKFSSHVLTCFVRGDDDPPSGVHDHLEPILLHSAHLADVVVVIGLQNLEEKEGRNLVWAAAG